MFAIVITAYNRAKALESLLKSLNRVNTIGESIELIISVDNKGTKEVIDVAESFQWKLGNKQIIVHQEKLGLVKHFIWAGDQTEKYENVLFLEDDLLVSPDVLNYTTQLIKFYENDSEVAAASLYNPILNESTGTKFYQVEDGKDVYFFQHPYWGNVWFKNRWKEFKNYLTTYTPNAAIIPPHIAQWDRSFKKIYVQFLIETNKTVVTARVSMVTNNGAMGIHGAEFFQYQNCLLLRKDRYHFVEPKESLAVYDAFVEYSPDLLKQLNPSLAKYNFDVDLNGTRLHYNSEYVLTTKPVKKAILSYTSLMKPIEQGVIMDESGNKEVNLAKVEDLLDCTQFISHRLLTDIRKNYFFENRYLIKLLIKEYIMKRLKRV